MPEKKKRPQKSHAEKIMILKKRLRRLAVLTICLSAAAAAIVGFSLVDAAVRVNLPNGSPPLWEVQQNEPLQYTFGLLGRQLGMDLSPVAAVAEEALAVAATPPAPVRAVIWVWLRLTQQPS